MRILNIDTYKSNINTSNYLAMKGVQIQKLIKRIEDAPRLKKVQITFDQLERMYNEIGYEVIHKPGSHASVHINDKINITVIIPHDDKYVNINDIKRFLLIKDGKLDEALAIRNHHK